MSQGEVLYRGSLKSCNYHCSYCPFSKHRSSERELERDKREWFRFVESLTDRMGGENSQALATEQGGFRALMVAPYGEALIHRWYWEGLAAVSRTERMEAVGAQTNLSFPLEKSLEYYRSAGGRLDKLRLWATFHPEMVCPEDFAQKCRQVWEAGVILSVGAVGAPEYLGSVQRLRALLPKEIYLWINKMDGLRRDYTEAETRAFLELDPYFWQELLPVPAEAEQCRERLFVESDGRMRACNIARVMEGNWYGEGRGCKEEGSGQKRCCPDKGATDRKTLPHCGRKVCSCYLAYGGRADYVNQILFGPHPIFRIPRRPKAVFLDIMGTLVPVNNEPGAVPAQAFDECRQGDYTPGVSRIPPRVRRALETLAGEGTLLFLATTLPVKTARRICQEAGELFSGGVFAGGAHVYAEWENGKREHYYRLECGSLSQIEALKKELGFRILSYRKGEMLYKLTFVRPGKKPWQEKEQNRLEMALEPRFRDKVRWIREEHCLQLVAREATKANGVRMICGWLGIPLSETAAAGDSPEDEEMIGFSGSSHTF